VASAASRTGRGIRKRGELSPRLSGTACEPLNFITDHDHDTRLPLGIGSSPRLSALRRELARAALAAGDVVVGKPCPARAADYYFRRARAESRPRRRARRDTPAPTSRPRRAEQPWLASHVDVLVNNAGYGLVRAVEEVSETRGPCVWRPTFRSLAITRALACRPALAKRAATSCNVSSWRAVIGFPAVGFYSASEVSAREFLTERVPRSVAACGSA